MAAQRSSTRAGVTADAWLPPPQMFLRESIVYHGIVCLHMYRNMFVSSDTQTGNGASLGVQPLSILVYWIRYLPSLREEYTVHRKEIVADLCLFWKPF